MDAERHDLALLDGRITGIAALPTRTTDKPVLVFIHGGGATARIFDIPGHSRILRAARNGFPAYALDRPGYGGSRPLDLPPDSDTGGMKAHAEHLEQAVADIWHPHRATAPGIVVVASSIGGAIAMHLASHWSRQNRPPWPLLGLACADIAQTPAKTTTDTHHPSTPKHRNNRPGPPDRPTAPPLWTLSPHQFSLPSKPGILQPVLRAEAMEIIGGWTREWQTIAASITVPVHYRLAQFDTLWTAQRDLVDAFATALRTRSPYVDAALFPGSAHGIADSIVGHEYCYQVLGFAERCAAAATTPQLLGN